MNDIRLVSLKVCLALVIMSCMSILSLAADTNAEAEHRFEKANEFRKLGYYDAAILDYKKVVRLSPNSEIAQIAQYWIGQMHLKAGRFDEAQSVFQRLLDENPTSASVPSAKQMMGQVQQAKETRSLCDAAKKGDLERVKLLIAEGADVNSKDEKESTPLCRAVESGKMELVQLLVDAGADVNAGSWPPLCVAVDENNIAVAEYLIEHGANVNAPEGWTAFQEAPYVASTEMIELLIANGADVNIGEEDGKGWTPLQSAIHEGHKDIVELLIQKGANTDVKFDEGGMNLKYERGMTILHLASACCNKQVNSPAYSHGMVELLLAHGTDINARDDQGRTSLHRVSNFLRHSNKEELRDVAKLLIAKGANVEVKDNYGRTPLFLVGNREVAELMIAKGAEVNARDNLGRTALHSAAENAQKEVAEVLINNGADLNARDKEGHTPLYTAVYHDFDVAELLINIGADGNIKTESGQTLLQLARERESVELRIPDIIFDGEPNSSFGDTIACGDVDGDGYDDLLVGAHTYDKGKGRVHLYYGGPDMDTSCDMIFEGDVDRFGISLCCGDIDNDSCADIIINAYQQKEDKSTAYLYWGGERASMDTNPDKVFAGEIGGRTVVYDIDNDGYRDIISGWQRYPGNYTGRVWLYYGNTKELMDTSPDLIFDAETPKERFGSAIGCGDVDNDGYGDIVIGAAAYPNRGRRAGIGRAYLYYGSSKDNMDTKVDKIFEAETKWWDNFSGAIAFIDENQDGYDDILIGARVYKERHKGRQGRTYLFYGNSRPNMDVVPDKILDGETEECDFGANIFIGDIDGDKRKDIIVQASIFRQQGKAYVYWGDELPATDAQPGRIITTAMAPNFTRTGLACGDMNNDGYDDLVIEAPVFKADSEKGRVYLYYGGPKNK